MVIARDMGPAVITNGWLLPKRLDELAAAGLKTVYVSIDAAAIEEHEANRGLKGVGERIRSATERMPGLGMTAVAQVTLNKLISDYRALVPLLRDLGLCAVAFSYPREHRLARHLSRGLQTPNWSILQVPKSSQPLTSSTICAEFSCE
jgi:MoaA/NifB/PqqE/SkfB family radical SAM enzyme